MPTDPGGREPTWDRLKKDRAAYTFVRKQYPSSYRRMVLSSGALDASLKRSVLIHHVVYGRSSLGSLICEVAAGQSTCNVQ